MQSLGLTYFWKRVHVPSTAGDCDLVGGTLTCTELWKAEHVTGSPDHLVRVTAEWQVQLCAWQTALCDIIHNQLIDRSATTSSSLVMGPWLGLWVVWIVCYALCIRAVGVTGRREFAPVLLLGPVSCLGTALSVCSLSCDRWSSERQDVNLSKSLPSVDSISRCAVDVFLQFLLQLHALFCPLPLQSPHIL